MKFPYLELLSLHEIIINVVQACLSLFLSSVLQLIGHVHAMLEKIQQYPVNMMQQALISQMYLHDCGYRIVNLY